MGSRGPAALAALFPKAKAAEKRALQQLLAQISAKAAEKVTKYLSSVAWIVSEKEKSVAQMPNLTSAKKLVRTFLEANGLPSHLNARKYKKLAKTIQ